MRLHAGQDASNEVSDAPYSIRAVTTVDELAALEQEWNRLSESAREPNVFMTYGWFRAWFQRRAEELPNGDLKPHVLVLMRENTAAGIMPFVLRVSTRMGMPIRRLEFVTNHADYNDLIVGESSEQMGAVFCFLAQTQEQWDAIYLRDLRVSAEEMTFIENAVTQAGLLYRTKVEKDACPYLHIEGDSEKLMMRLSGHVRRTLRGRMQRAASQGLRIRIIENPHIEPKLIERLAALEEIKQIHKSADAFIGMYPEVFQSLFDSLGPQGWIYVALLERGEQAVAFQLGFRCGDKLWDYSKAYDRSFASIAPGTLLLPALLDYGFEHKFCEYDFLRGEEEYKKVWTDKVHHRHSLLIWQQNAASRLRKLAYHDVGEWINGISLKKEHIVGR
jgi:CelD/BcsL family acetyltransferase involved in cellulose biosynthesis